MKCFFLEFYSAQLVIAQSVRESAERGCGEVIVVDDKSGRFNRKKPKTPCSYDGIYYKSKKSLQN